MIWLAPIPLLVAALSPSSLHETFDLAVFASLLGLIRAANQGVLTVSDPYGRIVAEVKRASRTAIDRQLSIYLTVVLQPANTQVNA